MGTLKRKLKSKHGASIILALLFFLICAVIGSIVLSSASSNAGRLSHMREEQAVYLSVSSAAKLLREELKGMEFEGIEDSREADPDFGPAATSTSIGHLSDLVEEMAAELYDGTSPAPKDFFVKPDSNILELKDVMVKLTMNDAELGQYSICAEISLDGDDERYAMELNIPATVSVRVEERQEPSTVTTGSDGVEEIEEGERYTITTTTITFGEGTITKGDAS